MTTIDGYVEEVAARLELRGRRRDVALATLRADLAAAASELGEAGAVEGFGPARETAARLAEEATRDRAAGAGRFSVPLSLDPRGIPARARAAFDPAEPRLFVPRVLGVGWDLNLGAAAVRLGLLRPDDLDDAQYADVRPVELARGRAGVAVCAAATAGLAVTGIRRGALLPAHWGIDGRPDRWAAPWPALAPALAVSAASVVLPAAVDAAGAGPRSRVGATVVATGLGSLATGLGALTVLGGSRRVGALALPVAVGAAGAGLAAGYATVRPALRRAWATATPPAATPSRTEG